MAVTGNTKIASVASELIVDDEVMMELGCQNNGDRKDISHGDINGARGKIKVSVKNFSVL